MKNNPPLFQPSSRTAAIAVAQDKSAFQRNLLLWIMLALFIVFGVLAANARRPKKVSAADLVGKVYGVADPHKGRKECRRQAKENFSAVPYEEDGAEWLSEAEGFVISYEGQSPESEAMARYDRNGVAGYGYIFYFPYEAAGRDKANEAQCRFCATLLEDLNEMGAIVGANPLTDELFDVAGIYKGGDIQLTLTEDVEAETIPEDMQAGEIPSDRSGQFILIMSVVPAEALQFTAELAQ